MSALGRFNALPGPAARDELLACCRSGAWAVAVAAGRPYPSVAAAQRRSDAAVAALTEADLAEALAGHPRIGERHAPTGSGEAGRAGSGRPAAWSAREQAGARTADGATVAALAAGNAEYERRYGHIYLVCAAGRSGTELLDVLRARLDHDPPAEWRAVRAELGKINQLRLAALLEEEHSVSPRNTA